MYRMYIRKRIISRLQSSCASVYDASYFARCTRCTRIFPRTNRSLYAIYVSCMLYERLAGPAKSSASYRRIRREYTRVHARNLSVFPFSANGIIVIAQIAAPSRRNSARSSFPNKQRSQATVTRSEPEPYLIISVREREREREREKESDKLR